MLPRRQRFGLRQDPTFFNRAQRISSAIATAFWTPSQGFSAAIVVPKKVAPKAVTRHRAKRLVHEALYLAQPTDDISLVISLKPSGLLLSLKDWQTEINQLLLKIRKKNTYESSSSRTD